MHSKIEKTRSLCRAAAKAVESAYPALKLCYIVHGRGQFAEAVALYEDEIITHPASESAQIILKKFIDQDSSSLLGMGIARKNAWLGLLKKEAYLALININADSYGDMEQMRHDIFHHAWHAVDLVEVCRKPENKKKYSSGPLIPKRSPYNAAKANMKADIFSATLRGLRNDPEPIEKLSRRRAMNVLKPQNERMAEDYPFVVAMEPSQFAFEDLLDIGGAHSKHFNEALLTADEVSAIVDEGGIGIEQWWKFAQPAQDMAWRGFPAEEILGAAINTSDDAYVRAIGYLISEVVRLEPKGTADLMHIYNAFTHDEQNEKLHYQKVDDLFEDMIDVSLKKESSEVMLLEAHAQNEGLLQGNVLGWCAHALQSSARAFESALRVGKEPAQAARIEFEGNKENVRWHDVNSLSEKIIERRRMGYLVTLGHVAELCEDIQGISDVLKSVQATMQDPAYIQKLKAGNELYTKPDLAPEPQAPAPKPAAPSSHYAPAAPAPAGPGMGGMMGGTRCPATPPQQDIQTEE